MTAGALKGQFSMTEKKDLVVVGFLVKTFYHTNDLMTFAGGTTVIAPTGATTTAAAERTPGTITDSKTGKEILLSLNCL